MNKLEIEELIKDRIETTITNQDLYDMLLEFRKRLGNVETQFQLLLEKGGTK